MNHIGKNSKTYSVPDDLVIDGQQRLTALLAAILGIQIKDKNYNERFIKISFNPLKDDFQVWSQAYESDPEYISAISEVFQAEENHNVSKFRRKYIKRVNDAREKNQKSELTDDEEDHIEDSINNLLNLRSYSLPTLKISAKANEEDVAEIFVRVNSGVRNSQRRILLKHSWLFLITQFTHKLINFVKSQEFLLMERHTIRF